MILPHSETAVLLLIVLGFLCWGSWVNAFKLAGTRFELFYYDFTLGALLAVGISAYTAGSMGFDGFTVTDDLLNAGRHQVLYGVLAGALLNFGNMLMMAAVVVAGMVMAFPVSFGIALVVSGGLSYIGNPSGHAALLLLGCALLTGAAVVDCVAHRRMAVLRHEALAKAGKAKSTRRPTAAKGLALAVVGGLLMGTAYPLLANAQDINTGLGPYSVGLVVVLGLFATTVVLNLFFLNLPVVGEPLELTAFFQISISQHLMGILGGVVWFAGMLAGLVAVSPRTGLHPDPALDYGLLQGGPVLAALWGIVAWKELKDADSRTRTMAVLMLVLFVLGLTLLALSRVPGGAA
jgi:glucose uptake protein